MRLVVLVSKAGAVLGSLPDTCVRFDRMDKEIERLEVTRETYLDLLAQKVRDIAITNVRIDALKSARGSLPRGEVPANRNFKDVADWFDATLVEIMNSAEARSVSEVSRAVASFVNAQYDAFWPFIGNLLEDRIAQEEKELSTLAGMRELHRKSAHLYSSRIALLSPGRVSLLTLCLQDIEALIRELEIERPTSSIETSRFLRAHWQRYLALLFRI